MAGLATVTNEMDCGDNNAKLYDKVESSRGREV